MNGPLPAVLCLALGLALGLALAPAAHAAPPATAQTEINYLLGFIENSACEFFRNGSWYDAKKAAAHLRGKYEILASAGRIRTAEDLIEEAGTKSGLSGLPYQVRCGGDKAVTTNQWLRDILARYRAHTTALGTPRPRRGVPGTEIFGPDRTLSRPA